MQLRHKAYAALAALVLANGTAGAAGYPERPVRIIVPFSPGGGTDIQGRVLADSFAKTTGETFLVDNRTGASGLIGAQLAVAEPADGYTILFTTATLSINPTLYGNRWTVDPLKDLAPVSWITSAPLVLVVHPSVPASSVKDLVAIAKKQPGLLNGAVTTTGSTSHLSLELLKQIARIETVVVPFRGGGPSVAATIAGQVDFMFATGPSVAPHVRSGRVRALAVTTANRSSTFPKLPTMNSIYPGFVTDNWYAMFVRAGTPQDVIMRINKLVLTALDTKRVKEFMRREAIDPVGSSPAELGAHVKSEMAKYAKIIDVAEIELK